MWCADVPFRLMHMLLRKLRLEAWMHRMGWYTPRIAVLVDGGLGSQMWQFALGYCSAKEHSMPFQLHLGFYRRSGKDLNGKDNRHFLLYETFPAVRDMCEQNGEPSWFFRQLFRDRRKRKTYDFQTPVIPENASVYLSQYYANARYIAPYRDELRVLFTMNPKLSPTDASLLEEIRGCSSCFVHIRKGDYIGSSLDVCSDVYYANAMHEMASGEQELVFFIFSNDEDYFPQYIAPLCVGLQYKIVRGSTEEDPRRDFYLMQACRHAIISNSGFSWMAAFLRHQPGEVMMPDYWNRSPERRESSARAFHIPGWRQLSC